MKASVIIVTRNRAPDLAETLASFHGIRVPAGFEAEVVVVDNGSSDSTAEVVRAASIPGASVRYLLEKRAGKSNGLNLGIRSTDGDIVLFTDDDVRIPADWLEAMCAPITAGSADVVAGGMELAPHLLRPWMTPAHRSWLASTEWLEPGNPESLVGANMAVSRKVFAKVPGFDPELGGGGLGFCEDGLFAAQLLKAGFRFTDRFDVRIIHHPDASRLMRSSWLDAAERRGLSHAYRGHHWEHWNCRLGWLKILKARRRLAKWRAAHHDHVRDEGCLMEELELVFSLGVVTGHLRESRRPRQYEKHGLAKIG